MLKLLGSVCVLGGGALYWLIALAERRRTRTALGDLLSALRRMREEIRMARTPLPLLLETLGSDCRGLETAALFQRSAEAALQGEGLETVWRDGVRLLPLAPREREVLENLTLRGDEESICKGISLVITDLARGIEELERQRPERDRRTAALCFSGAALLVILLI
ncbi:hypothetical protein JQM66_07005 [Oscillibacter valericigenes]|uniref:stage III sporulation protein AB n=1 Tax=Oscillibacter valericigenes TaxID=351091 RepID=UPI001F44C89F|nr:stage III sporulation protein AB [Oscillibacter valericigenes]MCF2664311.1 hypothetical protein [Oscillibacter valericigenes]